MADRALQHRRLHNLLLIQKLLSLREGSSPFTLLLDTVEQSSKPLIRQYIQNAKISKIATVFVSFETPKQPLGIDIMIKGRRKTQDTLHKEINAACVSSKKTLLIFDTLHPLASSSLPTFLSSLLTPHLTLLATYHLDIPTNPPETPYQPTPLTLLKYLATTILTTHSFPQTLARKRATDKSLPDPLFGLAEEKNGVIIGLGANDPNSLVLEMEHRRKSGRGVTEWYFLALHPSNPNHPLPSPSKPPILLEDHPLYLPPPPLTITSPTTTTIPFPSTFDLGLTARQREAREGVVLPYYDAQRGEGEGGRILYDMTVEDDFDEEEDEI